MMISTRGRYALRMMVDLAEHKTEGYISLKDIAERQEVSKKYLEQIIPMMNRSGLLQTVRGYQGGYRLSREPKEISVWEILKIWLSLSLAVPTWMLPFALWLSFCTCTRSCGLTALPIV